MPSINVGDVVQIKHGVFNIESGANRGLVLNRAWWFGWYINVQYPAATVTSKGKVYQYQSSKWIRAECVERTLSDSEEAMITEELR